MENLLALEKFLKTTKKYYIQTYDFSPDLIDVIKLSVKLVKQYGGHIYLGSDPGNLCNPFGLISKISIHFPNGFVLCYDGYHRYKGKVQFESILYFREKRIKNDTEKSVTTEFFHKQDYTYFELSNVDYTIGKEYEEFYWYNVASEIAQAPCGFHLLTLSTLESYAEYIANLNPKDFKLSRAPLQTWGSLSDKKIRFPLLLASIKKGHKKSDKNSEISMETKDSIQCIETSSIKELEKTSTYHIESKIHNESKLAFILPKKDYVTVD